MEYAYGNVPAAQAPAAARVEFIRQTYLHLGGAVLAFMALEWAILSSPLGAVIANTLLGTPMGWLLVLGGFMLVGYVAQKWAMSATSKSTQYAGLGLYVVAEAIIFVPILYIAAAYFGPTIIVEAGLYTALVFTGLTLTVFMTRKDFSFMRGALMIGGFAALGVIVASILFGFTLGTLFAGAMILLAGGYILYYTSNVLHHYPVGSHVAASLQLFAAVALLFWYILRLLMALRR
jgi:FtsH-binding integral membrane protein